MIIKNGKVALPGSDTFENVDIKIEDGKISEISSNLSGGIVLDVTGQYVF